ncbi:MAG: hypothetical protein WC702_00690 [Patescibacteria group bacterium]|jgi:hypothetical protein
MLISEIFFLIMFNVSFAAAGFCLALLVIWFIESLCTGLKAYNVVRIRPWSPVTVSLAASLFVGFLFTPLELPDKQPPVLILMGFGACLALCQNFGNFLDALHEEQRRHRSPPDP